MTEEIFSSNNKFTTKPQFTISGDLLLIFAYKRDLKVNSITEKIDNKKNGSIAQL